MVLPCFGVPVWFRNSLSSDFIAACAGTVYTCSVNRVLVLLTILLAWPF